MKKKTLCLILGAAMTGAVSVVSAEEQLTLSQMDKVTAGGFAFVDVELIVTKFKDVFERVDKFVVKDVNSFANNIGYIADAEAGANCYALNCLAETLTITDVRADLFTATAFSESLSSGNVISP